MCIRDRATTTRTVRHPPLSEEPAEVRAYVTSQAWKDDNAFDYGIVDKAAAALGAFFGDAAHRARLEQFVAYRRSEEAKLLDPATGEMDVEKAYDEKLLLDCRFGKNDLAINQHNGGSSRADR